MDAAHTAEGLVEEYEGEADEGQADVGLSTRADVEESEPVAVSRAATFVDAVIVRPEAREIAVLRAAW